jgi:hypothetical protein
VDDRRFLAETDGGSGIRHLLAYVAMVHLELLEEVEQMRKRTTLSKDASWTNTGLAYTRQSAL